MKLSAFVSLLMLANFSFSQELSLVDEIKGRFSTVKEVHVNEEGSRYFLIERAWDSIEINGELFIIPPKDTVSGSHYRQGRSYFAGVPADESTPFIHRPGGEILIATDTSILVFTTIFEDTLATNNGTYINHTMGHGSNLLLSEYNYNGDFIGSKQWKWIYDVHCVVHDAVYLDNRLFVAGRFTAGRPNQFLVMDTKTLTINSNGDIFIGDLNDDFEVQELIGIYGNLNEYFLRMTINREENLLIATSSTSTYATNTICPMDTVQNPSLNPWRTTFMFLNQFSSDYECLTSVSADFDYDGGLIEETAMMSDGSYLIYGVHGAGFLQYDNVRLENPDYSQTTYLFKFSPDLVATHALQIGGSSSGARITSLVVDNNDDIWISGISSRDSVIIDDILLMRGTATTTFWGFFAKLDANLNVMYANNMGEEGCYEMINGNDGELYLRTQVRASRHQRIYRIVDSVSAIEQTTMEQINMTSLYPNPVGDKLYYQIDIASSIEIMQICIHHADGRLVYQSSDIDQQEGIILNLPNGLYFVNFRLSDGNEITEKILVHR